MVPLLKKIAVRIMAYLLLALCVLWIFVKHLERTSIFYPYKGLTSTPREKHLPFEEVDIVTSDNLHLKAWFIPFKGSEQYVLFCHGNAGNLSIRVDKIDLLHQIGVNVFVFDYRGFGKSQGKPSERGVYLDALAAYEYLLKRKVSPEAIIVYGESLGSSVAVDLASKKKIAGVILEGAFSSAKDMGKIMFPVIPSFLVSDSFNSLKKIKNVRVPLLCMHTKDDDVVPLRLGQKLYEAALQPKTFVTLHGTHNNAFLDSKEIYLEALGTFLKTIKDKPRYTAP